MVSKINLSKEHFTRIDRGDREWLSKYNWSYSGHYAKRKEWINGTRKSIYMHREILSYHGFNMNGKETDHINRDKLDNRKSNLRVASDSLNTFNRNLNSRNKSGYTGVLWDGNHKKWKAYIGLDYKLINLGFWITKKQAISARQLGEEYLYGELL